MMVYSVFDEAESEEYFFPNKKEAMSYFNDVDRGIVKRIETVEPTKSGVLAMLNRKQYATKMDTIAEK